MHGGRGGGGSVPFWLCHPACRRSPLDGCGCRCGGRRTPMTRLLGSCLSDSLAAHRSPVLPSRHCSAKGSTQLRRNWKEEHPD
jgi:hypothetical protein